MASNPKPVWAGRMMRLDPSNLPQIISYRSHDDLGEVVLTVRRRGVRVRRLLEKSLLPVTFVLPPNAFMGVAARAIEENGEVLVTLELMHADPKLSVPLLVASDLGDVASDWRVWSEIYGLPMLLVEANGEVSRLEDAINGIAVRKEPRRRNGARRIRFLSRKRGRQALGVRIVVDGEELTPKN